MSLHRTLSLLAIPVLGGCFAYDSEPEKIKYSPGFFASFDSMVDEAKTRPNEDATAATFTKEFMIRVNDGPAADELYAVGPAWEKVRSFLDIGLLSAEVLASVNNSAHQRVDVFSAASDRVLRSDFMAISAWNKRVTSAERIEPTTELVWESLYLVLKESAHAQRTLPTNEVEWIAGHWTRGPETHKDLWVKGYYETVWHDEVCRDEYAGTSCTSYWVDESCVDVLVDDGYYDSTCTGYDEDGNCVEYTDVWVDTSYYVSECTPGQYVEECNDVYQSVCDPGHWEDVSIAAHTVKSVAIPGELVWVEAHEADKAGERIEVLPQEEATILALGIEYVMSFGPGFIDGACTTQLETARAAFDVETPEDSIRISRDAILYCLSQH